VWSHLEVSYFRNMVPADAILDLVVKRQPAEMDLLLQEIGTGRFGGLQLQGQVHAFVAAVLLRVARFDALDGDAEPEPPDRQPGKIEESIGACEGHPVVRPNWACPAWHAQSASRFGKEADWRAGKAGENGLSDLPVRCRCSA
jgi:hypothetical protein